MAKVLIGYETEGADGERAFTALVDGAFGSSWHCLHGLWVVQTEMTPLEVRDQLAGEPGTTGRLFVVDITSQPTAWRRVEFPTAGA